MELTAGRFFTSEQKEQILQAIRTAEKHTSGEIKVHLERYCADNVLDRAANLFHELGMSQTELRNGVLIYVAYQDRKFAILGDASINAAVPSNFWDDIKVHMQTKFRAAHFTEGIIEGIEMAGQQLKEHFPHRAETDQNELNDDLSFGDN